MWPSPSRLTGRRVNRPCRILPLRGWERDACKPLLALVLLLTLTGSLWGEELFVDPVEGSDLNTGDNPSDALRTLRKGIRIAQEGSTVVALPGIYSGGTNGERFPLEMKPGVSLYALEGPETTFIMDDMASATPDGTISFDIEPGQDFDETYVTGFTLDGMNLATNLAGIMIRCAGTETGVSPVIKGNIIRNYTGTYQLSIDGSGILTWVEASGSFTAASPVIEANLLMDNDEGVTTTVLSVEGQGLSVAMGQISNNFIINHINGIACVSSPWPETGPRRGTAFVSTHIVNNTIFGSMEDGIQLWSFDAISENAVHPVIANNIIQGCSGYGIAELGFTPEHADPDVLSANNIFACNLGLYLDESTTTLTTHAEVNCLPEALETPNNLSLDALFVEPTEPDLHLRLDSPLADYVPTGDEWAPPFDFDGDPRPTGLRYEVGADEIIPEQSVLLRDKTVTSLNPPIPPRRSDYLPLDPVEDAYDELSPGARDEEDGILSDRDHPLVFYQLLEEGPVLFLVKEPEHDSVVFWF